MLQSIRFALLLAILPRLASADAAGEAAIRTIVAEQVVATEASARVREILGQSASFK